MGLVRPTNRFTRRYRELDADSTRTRDVDWVSGAAIWLRRRALEAIDGWDDHYFMYVEDVDLCWRLQGAGWGVAMADEAVVRHVVGASSEQQPYRMIIEHHRSLWRFARRSTRGAQRLALPLIGFALVVRAGFASVRRAILRRPPATH